MYITKDSADIYVDMVITDSETNQTSNERIQLNANLANALRNLETNGTNTKLNIGSEIQPIYFENGVPKLSFVFVDLETNQTITGKKTFTQSIVVNTDPTSDSEVATKRYVDSHAAGFVIRRWGA